MNLGMVVRGRLVHGAAGQGLHPCVEASTQSKCKEGFPHYTCPLFDDDKAQDPILTLGKGADTRHCV